jgi:NADPH-dependent 2,4-dienoyl-CoA reductase/sulfur reductase-like enzyme
LLLRGRVAGLDAGQQTVTLADGSTLAYDRLLIATGAHPVRPPIPGIDLPQVLSCWTLADARRHCRPRRPGARVLQMGAGFIGCIIMESLAARGPQLTVVEMGDRMVPRMLDEVAGAMIRRWCEGKGVRSCTGRRVVAIEPAGEALRVTLDDGESVEVDALINATGVKPNVDFLAGSGVAVDIGILVDDSMQTSVAGIYAAGDVAEAVEFGTGRRVVNAIQPDAVEQARIAASTWPARRQPARHLRLQRPRHHGSDLRFLRAVAGVSRLQLSAIARRSRVPLPAAGFRRRATGRRQQHRSHREHRRPARPDSGAGSPRRLESAFAGQPAAAQ